MERHALEEETRNRILQTSLSERSELKTSPNRTILPKIYQHKPNVKPEKVVGPGKTILTKVIMRSEGTY
jgi:hypothetical protein